ncbi:class I SAM-dependent methyltransferase [Hyalangium gracile]|uniref:class I SAM-dependent methyltransferase n=1 Tax=Hyalangium gracile TaxID=394092 RepID=UPI001CCC021D|nr:class I SAM-dependent methyltransferase [Hyalangium gracile]
MANEQSDPWGQHAATYARFGSPFTGYIGQSLFLSVAGRLPREARILEIACGTGDLARAAVLHCLEERRTTGRCGSVVATDFSPGMVELAKRTLAAFGVPDVARCEVQDGQALGFDADSFDAVFSAFGIFLFPDRAAGWREAARVLRPGGLFATAVWRGPEDNALARLQMAPVMSALPERVRASLPRPPWLDIASAEGLTKEVRAAGFVAPEVSVFNAVLTAPTPRAMWDMMRDNPVSRLMLSACSHEELAAVERSVLSTFEEMAGGTDRPVRFDASCHFLIARRA